MYTCETEFHSIDFLFAERLCPQGPSAATYFLAHLMKSAREGHMFLSINEYPTLREGFSLLPKTLFEHVLVKRGECVYLKRNWECETTFISHLKRIKSHKPSLSIDPDDLTRRLHKLSLNTEQKKAISKAAENTLTLILGGPGTGKTYTATSLIRLFIDLGIKNSIVAAPTGKATANLRAALGPFAEKCVFKTLHSLLKQEHLHADLVVVDEGSMVDAERMKTLFAAIPEGARLILLGDKDQLPPIESGNFFADLAQDYTLVAELTTCLRCELKEIIDQATQVKMGLLIPTHPLPDIKSLVNMILEKKACVLTPLKKGLYGVDHLNQLLYEEHQKINAREIPIIITINDPYLNLFNGDIGTLIPQEKIALFADGRKIPEYRLPFYEYAYAISVHKSQGSEYDNTIILLPKGSEIFGREMLYTAITRSKKQMVIFSEEKVVEQLIKTHYRRRSGITIQSNKSTVVDPLPLRAGLLLK